MLATKSRISRSAFGAIRVALLAQSPMHYQVPLYRLLASDPRIDFTAIFASSAGVRSHDPGYNRSIVWDVDLLSGYKSIFLKRANKNELGGGFLSNHDVDVVAAVSRGRYEVLWLHGYNSLTHQLALFTQRARGKPVLLREEQTLLHGRSAWKLVAKKILLPLLMGSTFGLFIGSENRRWLRHYGIPDNRLFFAPYAVENERFQAEATRLANERDQVRAEFGLRKAGGPVILFMGRMIDKKQPLFVLEAFRRVRERQECQLLMVGSGPLENEVRSAIIRDKIQDVSMAGFLNQTEISRAYASADIFVLASRAHETWGLVVNEAMNFGLPIILSDKVGCAPDLLRDTRNGFIVSSAEPSQLAKRLATLVASEGLRRSFGRASFQLINQWTHQMAVEGVIAAVRCAVGEPRWEAASGDTRTMREASLGRQSTDD